ncbi:MAG TPA: hemerythrin domain-containing protein [Acidimicrobiales bacterium]|nr:hemerythrin domain-containing protein [Acidimicrobiales bacterium]
MANGSNGACADIRLIQAVHNTFRSGLTRMIDATSKLDPAALQPSVGPYWNFYSAILDYHHHNEDDVDFPMLAGYYPDIQPTVDELGADHREMLDVMAKINVAVETFQNTPDAAGRDGINGAAVELRELFFPHLDREDAEVLPMYAKWIPHDEWDKLETKTLKGIPKPVMPYAVGALDETISSTPEAERPEGPPLPVKIFLSLSWRKKWAGLSEPLRT